MASVEFDEVRFPEDVSFGSSGGPTFKTSVFEAYRGGEKRNVDWASPLMEFDVAYGIKTTAQMARVIEFFNARRGKLRGFRYKNWANYEVINDNIAIGDGVNQRLPIVRTYGFTAARTFKRLHKIVRGSVRGVSVGGVDMVENEDFSIDYNGGEIIFRSGAIPAYGVPVIVERLEFDEPVRFDVDNLSITIEQFNNNSVGRLPLVGIRDTFTAGTVPAPDATQAGSPDQFFDSTRLLLKFDDVSNLGTTVDESPAELSVTINGAATLQTDVFAAGGGSARFGGDGYISVDGTTFDLSNVGTPFTFEAFIRRPGAGAGADQQMLFGKWVETGGERGYAFTYIPNGQRLLFLVSSDGSAESIVLNYPWTEGDEDSWQHVSVNRLPNGRHVLRINGVVVQTAGAVGVINDPAVTFNIGGFTTPEIGQGSFAGDIDSFRFTYGRNRYAGTLFAPAPQPDYPA